MSFNFTIRESLLTGDSTGPYPGEIRYEWHQIMQILPWFAIKYLALRCRPPYTTFETRRPRFIFTCHIKCRCCFNYTDMICSDGMRRWVVVGWTMCQLISLTIVSNCYVQWGRSNDRRWGWWGGASRNVMIRRTPIQYNITTWVISTWWRGCSITYLSINICSNDEASMCIGGGGGLVEFNSWMVGSKGDDNAMMWSKLVNCCCSLLT